MPQVWDLQIREIAVTLQSNKSNIRGTPIENSDNTLKNKQS